MMVSQINHNDNPLHERPDLREKVNSCFANNADVEIWTENPDLFYWSGDYRKVKVMKISYFYRFIKAFANAFFIVKEFSFYRDPCNDSFEEQLKEKILNFNDIQIIEDLFDADKDTVANAILGLQTDSWLDKMQNAFSYGTFASYMLTFFDKHRFIGVLLAILLKTLTVFSTKSILLKEWIYNISEILNSICLTIVHYHKEISKSNVFILAIDERKFNPLFLFNCFRKNDLYWCDFSNIQDLPNSLIAEDCPEWSQFEECMKIITELISQDSIDFEAIRCRINGL